METFRFHLNGTWNGGRLGTGRVEAGELRTNVSIPGNMGGPGVGTNPDELLLSAAANCYMITLASLLERRDLGIASFKLASEGTVIRDGGKLQYKSIVHRPRLTIQDPTDERIEVARQCCERAEKACMISQALRGNVEITVEPTVD